MMKLSSTPRSLPAFFHPNGQQESPVKGQRQETGFPAVERDGRFVCF